MADSAKYHPRPTTPPRDAEGRLATDLPCVGCGYNLRTQPREGACPECAIPVFKSFAACDLRFSPRRWLQRIYAAMLWLALLLGLMALLQVVYLMASPITSPVTHFIMQIGFALSAFMWLGLIGWCSTPEERRFRGGGYLPGQRLRRALRWLAAAEACCIAINLSLHTMALHAGQPSSIVRWLWGLNYILMIALTSVVTIVLFAYLRAAVFKRLPAPRWSRLLLIAMWLLAGHGITAIALTCARIAVMESAIAQGRFTPPLIDWSDFFEALWFLLELVGLCVQILLIVCLFGVRWVMTEWDLPRRAWDRPL